VEISAGGSFWKELCYGAALDRAFTIPIMDVFEFVIRERVSVSGAGRAVFDGSVWLAVRLARQPLLSGFCS